MARCLAILVTGVREGWGLVVTVVDAKGRLTITINVPGIVDANETGLIAKKIVQKN